MVVSSIKGAEKEYTTALRSMRCYCKMHNYAFRLVEDDDFRGVCDQKDVSFGDFFDPL